MKRINSIVFALALCALLGAESANAVPTFYVLNTEGNENFRGRIDEIDIVAGTRTPGIADVDPTPFSAIESWKGFATDGQYWYFLNTDGGNAFPGRIDRTNLDGSGRTQIADIDPSVFGAVENWQGFATDGRYFYLLNTEGASGTDGSGIRGRIDRINMDGSGRTTIVDVETSPFNNITSWKGFATDGQAFYYLNTDGGDAFIGRIDMTDLNGNGRTQIYDVDPGLFGNITAWQGFAASVIPEPTTALLGLGGLVALGMRRRRNAA